jgi:hypothetical protein
VNFLVGFVGGTWVWFYGNIVPYSKMISKVVTYAIMGKD